MVVFLCDTKNMNQELPETFGFAKKQLFITENRRLQAPYKNAGMLPRALSDS